MPDDRTLRRLTTLAKSGSTARVLNVHGAHARALDAEELLPAFFENKLLNYSLIVKHRLRAFERSEVDTPRKTATKLLIPIDITDLRAGARSVFVGQRDFDAICAHEFGDAMAPGTRDYKVLQLLDELPSLDPFLMREHLRRNGIEAGRAYFAITEADIERMHAFVSKEVHALAELCGGGSDNPEHTARLVTKLLSDERGAEFAPLQLALKLSDKAYEDGIFAWRGFLYYKWALSEIEDVIPPIMNAVKAIGILGKADAETKAYISGARDRIVDCVQKVEAQVRMLLNVYNRAYADLTVEGKPMAFRSFLLSSPTMFLGLGEQLGSLQHVVSFWKYRFPEGAPRSVLASDLQDIFQDFEESLVGERQTAQAWT